MTAAQSVCSYVLQELLAFYCPFTSPKVITPGMSRRLKAGQPAVVEELVQCIVHLGATGETLLTIQKHMPEQVRFLKLTE